MLKRSIGLLLCGALSFWLCSCTKVPEKTTAPVSEPVVNSNATDAAVEPAASTDKPKEDEKACFACKGAGKVKCTAPGCVDGMVDCPGPCLKLDRGVWVHMPVAGHPPTDVWQKFYLPDGSYSAYNQGHVGHVIAMQGGQAVDTGACKICGGSGKVPCSVCKGTGQVTCPICEGKKVIPLAWSPTNNPWLNGQPDLIRLNDGQIMFGTVMTKIGSDVSIKLRGGKWVHVNATNLPSKTDATGSAVR